MNEYELGDANQEMRRAVYAWVRGAMMQDQPPASLSVDTSYGPVVLTLPRRPQPVEAGEIEVVVYFNPGRNGYFVREYDQDVTAGQGYIPVARVSVPWRLGQGLRVDP